MQHNQFERAYRDHYSRVRSFLRVYVGDPPVADDLAQETFLHLWTRPDAYDPRRASLKTYLLGVARKKAADWWRHAPRVDSLEESVPVPRPGEAMAMKDALARLEPEQRNVLWLREAEGYSYDELAGILAIPVGTVRSRLFTAREQLRRIWRNE